MGLPTELVYLVIVSADFRTIGNIGTTNKYLHEICGDERIWRHITGRDYGKDKLPPLMLLWKYTKMTTLRRPYLWRDYYKDLFHDNIIDVEVVIDDHKDTIWIKGNETMKDVKNKLLSIAKKYTSSQICRLDVYFAWNHGFRFYDLEIPREHEMGDCFTICRDPPTFKKEQLWNTRSIHVDVITKYRSSNRYGYMIVNKKHYIWYHDTVSAEKILERIKAGVGTNTKNVYVSLDKSIPKLRLYLEHDIAVIRNIITLARTLRMIPHIKNRKFA